jgi:hypothetical protein
MPEFISKLQYKTYEKGEYSDEKVRNLEETIELIKSFPWEQQRGVDVQLTGPSVTIQDEYGNYLKAGLYFNSKFCLYYFDCDHHLYEYHAPDLDDVLSTVGEFFKGQVDLTKFEKHLFNIGNSVHFLSNDFIYRVKGWRVVLLSTFFIVFFLMFLLFTIGFASKAAPFYIFGIPLLFSLLFGGILIHILKCYLACSNQVLQISTGNNIFCFDNDDGNRTYDKNDIKEIIKYIPGGGRNPNSFVVYEIHFKDESIIKFSNMLISDINFGHKFSNDLIVIGKKASLWQL